MVAPNTSSIIRTSVAYNRAPANASSDSPFASGNGRFVTFWSYASNLTPGDTNGQADVFLRDTLNGTTLLVSMAYDGSPANGASDAYTPSVSEDGRFVAFYSTASNLVPGDTEGKGDVFVADMQSGTTIRLSETSAGVGGNNVSGAPQILGRGRFVAYESSASNLVTGDTNNARDVFVRDLLSGQTAIISRSSAGVLGNNISEDAHFSGDGRFVVFESLATNLVTGDTNNAKDIFLRDTGLNTTVRVSVATGGAQASGGSADAQVSYDGRFVVFSSSATNLVAGDTNGVSDIFLRDMETGTTTRLSVSSAGVQSNNGSSGAAVAARGQFVVFESDANNLVAGDTNGLTDIFLRNLYTNTTTRLSVGLGGVQANGSSFDPRILDPLNTPDGYSVVFKSGASNLVAGDTNGVTDTFRISLFASDAADYLLGSDGADTINGLAGSDIIDGGLGADTMVGGSGDDTFYVDAAGDRVTETGGLGIDTVYSSAPSYTLEARASVEVLRAADTASMAAQKLFGNELAQALIGGNAMNYLFGRGGNDTLTGGLGNDLFCFDLLPNASTNIDTITDFANAAGNDDRVALENSKFTKLTATGKLNGDFFAANATGKATDADDYIVYNTSNGALFYDADGNTAGGQAAVQFAIISNFASLTGTTALSAADILVY